MSGLALLETVLKNHSAKNLDNPMASWGLTYRNPVVGGDSPGGVNDTANVYTESKT